MTPDELRKSLSPQQVIKALGKLGVTIYHEDEKSIQFPTICHNAVMEEASLKLYYYKDTQLFHCYTECGDSFNIFELYKRFYETRGIQYNFYDDIYDVILRDSNINFEEFQVAAYTRVSDKYNRRTKAELTVYPESLLNVFIDHYTEEWLYEGITVESMKKYNIKYSPSQNKIIIPHYSLDGKLIGIRGRALNPEDIEKGKYRPVWIQNQLYNHPLSLNLYGLNKTIDDVNKTKQIILFESEKSVLLMDSYFDINNSVAVCGSNFNKNQLDIILKNTKASECIIAFDKEYSSHSGAEADKYFSKLRSIGEKYNNYCDFYYIADKENLLKEKDSPIDRGPEIFKRLMSKKVKIGV